MNKHEQNTGGTEIQQEPEAFESMPDITNMPLAVVLGESALARAVRRAVNRNEHAIVSYAAHGSTPIGQESSDTQADS